MKSRIFAAISAGVLLLAGCSGGGDSGGKNSPTPIERFQSARGLALTDCSFSSWTIRFLDPANGKERLKFNEKDVKKLLDKADKATSGDLNVDSPCDNPQVFSPDRRKMAVTIKDFPDNSQHVGIVDITNGSLTDVTKTSIGSGYTQQIPEDKNPRFAPNGDFWFSRDDKAMTVKANETKPVEGRQSSACSKFFGGDFSIAGTIATTCDFPHPSGVFSVSRDGDDGLEFTFLTQDAKSLQVKVKAAGKSYSCEPTEWIGDNKILCRDGEGEHRGYRILPLNPSAIRPGARLATLNAGPLIIPPADRDVLLVATSPDQQQILIMAQAGDLAPVLYRVSAITPGIPTEVTKLNKDEVDSNTSLFDWR